MPTSTKHEELDGNQTQNPRRRLRRVTAVTVGGLLWIGLPIYVWIAHGWQAVEKTLTAFAMPVGLIWSLLLLVGLIAIYRGQKWQAISSLGVAMLLGLLGNGWIAEQLNSVLERPVRHLMDESPGSYDAVILLGGATRMGASGEPELNWHGQRLVLAAQLYHAGRTERIIATGGNPVFTDDEPSPGEQSRVMLESLGVPGDVIETLPGRNTREEMAALSLRFGKLDARPTRLGVITNAGHMPRALRLAEKAGLEVEPIPCIFHGRANGHSGFGPLTVIPSAYGIVASTTACYEFLARMVGQ